MIFTAMLFTLAPALGMVYMLLAVSLIDIYLTHILKAVLVGGAAIVLIPRLLSAAPIIIFLAALVILVKGMKRVVGFLLG